MNRDQRVARVLAENPDNDDRGQPIRRWNELLCSCVVLAAHVLIGAVIVSFYTSGTVVEIFVVAGALVSVYVVGATAVGIVHNIVRAPLTGFECKSCRQSLLGLPAEDDGCVICPECGAAWKLPR